MNLTIDTARLTAELDLLAEFSDTPAPAVTRLAYSRRDAGAREYVVGLCREAGLEVRQDAVGNFFARLGGADPELPAVATGAHLDAGPHAGRFDGAAGVLGALAAIRALRATGGQLRRPLELIGFAAGEPARFGVGCLGSRLLAGALPAWKGERLSDRDGKTLDQWRAEAGFEGSLESVAVTAGHYAAFVELQVEEGAELPLGIVTAIAATAGLRVTVEGAGGQDALRAAAEIVLDVERIAQGAEAADGAATVGTCDVFPGTPGRVPSRVRLEVNVRDMDEARGNRTVAGIVNACRDLAQRRRLSVKAELLHMDPAGECHAEAVEALVRAAERHGLGYRKTVSRGCRDALFLSRIAAPTGLLLTAPEAIGSGALVLAETLGELAGQ